MATRISSNARTLQVIQYNNHACPLFLCSTTIWRQLQTAMQLHDMLLNVRRGWKKMTRRKGDNGGGRGGIMEEEHLIVTSIILETYRQNIYNHKCAFEADDNNPCLILTSPFLSDSTLL